MSWMSRLNDARQKPAVARDEAQRLANEWSTDITTREKVDANLKAQGLDADAIMAESFVGAIDKLEALERMMASAERRRNDALREIERRRSAIARALRQSSDQIIADEAQLMPKITG
jgi:ABC-type phosphate/phosphonate transport system ATPase subunit